MKQYAPGKEPQYNREDDKLQPEEIVIKGGIYENLIAGILERKGYAVRYYRNEDFEVEFIIETEQGVVPIEVKSTTGRTLSLDKLLANDDIAYGFKLTHGNVGVSGKKITLPHYMAMFI